MAHGSSLFQCLFEAEQVKQTVMASKTCCRRHQASQAFVLQAEPFFPDPTTLFVFKAKALRGKGGSCSWPAQCGRRVGVCSQPRQP